MSSIPKTAFPRTWTKTDQRPSRRARLNGMMAGSRRWASSGYDAASRTVRDHPRIAVSAIGAALVATLAAVFGPSLWRRRSAFGL